MNNIPLFSVEIGRIETLFIKEFNMKFLKILVLPLIIFLSACDYDVELIDFESGETLKGGFNINSRLTWVELKDGTRLEGKYVEIRNNDSFSFGNSTGTLTGSTTGSIFSGSKFGTFNSLSTSSLNTFSTSTTIGNTSIGYAILRNPDTKVMMEVVVIANLDNSGMGEARTNDGKTYKVMF